MNRRWIVMVGKLKVLASLILLVTFFISINVHAVSVSIAPPEDIIEQSDVIVQGTYDFSVAKTVGNRKVHPFRVIQLFKGHVPEELLISVSSDEFDRISEVQRNGGQIILFLRSRYDDSFAPLYGENGYIPISEGKISLIEPERAEVFNAYFDRIGIPILNVQTQSQFWTTFIKILPFFIGIILIIIVLWIFLRRSISSKSSPI